MKTTRLSLFMTMLFFGVFGIAVEVFFTAFFAFFTGNTLPGKSPMAMAGFTYVWMLPIYMLIPFMFKILLPYVIKYPLILRLFIYVGLIYVVEFISGFLLEQVTGSCPWEYTTGLHIMGYVQLYYFPAWMLFAFIIEKMYRYLSEKI